MKKKALVSAIVTLAVCLCLIAGSTYALFTTSDEVNIAINAGKVKMFAELDNETVYSVKGQVGGDQIDEFGNEYIHVEQANMTFANLGTAKFDDGVIDLSLITPGDKVSFTLKGRNESNVLTKYRYSITCLEGFPLMSGLIVTINDVQYESLEHYISAWNELDPLTDMASVEISIELPVAAGNYFQELATKIQIRVEAVQANGVVTGVEDIKYIDRVDSDSDIAAAILDPNNSYIVFAESVEGVIAVNGDASDKIIDACGNDIALDLNGNFQNVVITGIVDTDGATRSIDVGGASGDITVTNCDLLDANGSPFGCIYTDDVVDLDLTIDECDFTSNGGTAYGVYGGGSGDLTITNCTFTGFTKWAILPNGDVNGDMTVDGCTFTNCTDGLVKAGVKGDENSSGTIEGVFTFTNNKVNNCAGHDSKESEMFEVELRPGTTGNLIATGNTRDDRAWTPDPACGFGA